MLSYIYEQLKVANVFNLYQLYFLLQLKSTETIRLIFSSNIFRRFVSFKD
jgi:hypothetical protein